MTTATNPTCHRPFTLFLEPLDIDCGLFPQQRLQLMRGSHIYQDAPIPGDITAAPATSRDHATCVMFTLHEIRLLQQILSLIGPE